MKILVIGSEGYIGSKLVPFLIRKEHEVKIADISHGIDITSHGVAEDLFKEPIDSVINLAATFNKDETLSRNVNFTAACFIGQLCEKYKVKRLIFTSTCGVLNPNDHSSYTTNKANAESFLLKHIVKTKVIVARLATVYGKSPKMSYEPLVNNMVRQGCLGHIDIFKANEFRPVIHINDAVVAIQLLLRKDNGHQVYNLVTGNHRKAEIASTIQKHVSCKLTIETDNSNGYKVYLDPNLGELGFDPQYTLENSMAELVDYELKKRANTSEE